LDVPTNYNEITMVVDNNISELDDFTKLTSLLIDNFTSTNS
jgi:hypothetical protein